MEIIRKEIPKEFLEVLPEGMKFIYKQGKEFLVVEKIYCPHGHNLVDDTVRIHGESAIKINIKIGHCEGTIFIDAFWGSHAKLYSFIPRGSTLELVDASCPTCGESLIIDSNCNQDKCSSDKSIQMILPGGQNKIIACARFGCPGHELEIKELHRKVTKIVSEINYFGVGLEEDDLFKGV